MDSLQIPGVKELTANSQKELIPSNWNFVRIDDERYKVYNAETNRVIECTIEEFNKMIKKGLS